MKDKQKKKQLKARRKLGYNKEFSVYKPKFDAKKVYEMPAEFNKHLRGLTELIESRDAHKRMLPIMTQEERREMIPLLRRLDESIEEFEQRMADEYEDFQKREANIERVEEEKQEAVAVLYDHIQRGFIMAKHWLSAETFQPFEKKWTGQMGKAEREEFYELVAHRESYDLENILAYPNGYFYSPMKHPMIQSREAHFEVERVAYVTPDDFKELEADYEQALAIRDKIEKTIWLYNPEHRLEKIEKVKNLDKMIDIIKPKLIEFLAVCFAETGKIEVENPDEKKLEAAFAQLEIASDRQHIMVKHHTPHLYEEYREVIFRDMTAEEIKEEEERIAKRETDELDKILASLNPPEADALGK
jgi:hypothetical protein